MKNQKYRAKIKNTWNKIFCQLQNIVKVNTQIKKEENIYRAMSSLERFKHSNKCKYGIMYSTF